MFLTLRLEQLAFNRISVSNERIEPDPFSSRPDALIQLCLVDPNAVLYVSLRCTAAVMLYVLRKSFPRSKFL